MKIYGNFVKTKEYLSSGKQIFLLKKAESYDINVESPYVLCEGVLLHKNAKLPLCLEGEYNPKVHRFFFTDYQLLPLNNSCAAEFIADKGFRGFGKVTIEKLFQVSTSDFFTYINYHMTALDDFINNGTPETGTVEFVTYIKKINAIESIYRYIRTCNGKIENVESIYNKYGDNALKMLKSNPYKLIYAGLSFEECDEIARSIGIPYYDHERLKSVIRYVIEQNHCCGNTRITVDALLDWIKRIEKKEKIPYTNEYFIANELLSNKYILVNEDNDCYVYLKKVYDEEMSIATNIRRLNNVAKTVPQNPVSIEELEKKCNITYGAKQKEALMLLNTPGIKILTGGPGTGKTTTLNGILTKFKMEFPNEKVLLCAPTGCAAKRMKESTHHFASTIHKALDIRPYLDDTFITMVKELDYACIIIDECSFLDTENFSIFLKCVKTGTRILLVGDKDQLPSVRYGNIFEDLINSEKLEVCRLDVNYRQMTPEEAKNSIISNAIKINHGDIFLTQDEKTEIIREKDALKITDKVLELYERLYDKNDADSVKCYTLTKKKYATSSRTLNNLIKERINPVGDRPYFYSNGYLFSEGDLVMMNRNNYEKGYINGDVGRLVVVNVKGFEKEVVVEIDDEEIQLSNKNLQDLELGYAITTHKAQGAECKNAILVFPKEPNIMLVRKILYVAATRAKKKNYIITEGNAIECAIKNDKKCKRNTGLLKKLNS